MTVADPPSSSSSPALQPSTASNVVPAAPYERRCPSPPFMSGPVGKKYDTSRMKLVPSYENIDPAQLTLSDLEIITQNRAQIAEDRTMGWTYEQRRTAQPILDFLYLGPRSVVRDQDYLVRENVTMILIARHASMASQRLASVEEVSQRLGIPVAYVDLDGDHELIRGFPQAISLINKHLLSVYHSQAQGRGKAGQMLVEPASFRRGKVLVVCDSGNDRSATVVAAYIMAMFGKDMWSAIEFISVQRFCCTFTEELKRMLQTWDDMLKARAAVAMNRAENYSVQPSLAAPSAQASGGSRMKRGLDDLMDIDDMSSEDDVTDRERFQGRETFTPFVDGH